MKFTVEDSCIGWAVKNTKKYPGTLYLTKIYKGVPEFSKDYSHAKRYTTESAARKIAAQLSR